MVVSGLALISSRPAGYRCGIWLRPNLFTPGVVSLQYSASLYFSGVIQVVVTVPVHRGREIGLWREIICNLNLLRLTLQAICAPPRRTTPLGLPSLPSAKQIKRTKEILQQSRKASKHNMRTLEKGAHRKNKRKTPLRSPIPSRPFQSCYCQSSNAPKSGSGESESVSSAWIIVELVAKQRCAEWPKPVARRN